MYEIIALDVRSVGIYIYGRRFNVDHFVVNWWQDKIGYFMPTYPNGSQEPFALLMVLLLASQLQWKIKILLIIWINLQTSRVAHRVHICSLFIKFNIQKDLFIKRFSCFDFQQEETVTFVHRWREISWSGEQYISVLCCF